VTICARTTCVQTTSRLALTVASEDEARVDVSLSDAVREALTLLAADSTAIPFPRAAGITVIEARRALSDEEVEDEDDEDWEDDDDEDDEDDDEDDWDDDDDDWDDDDDDDEDDDDDDDDDDDWDDDDDDDDDWEEDEDDD
jgi:hypothetical protein